MLLVTTEVWKYIRVLFDNSTCLSHIRQCQRNCNLTMVLAALRAYSINSACLLTSVYSLSYLRTAI